MADLIVRRSVSARSYSHRPSAIRYWPIPHGQRPRVRRLRDLHRGRCPARCRPARHGRGRNRLAISIVVIRPCRDVSHDNPEMRKQHRLPPHLRRISPPHPVHRTCRTDVSATGKDSILPAAGTRSARSWAARKHPHRSPTTRRTRRTASLSNRSTIRDRPDQYRRAGLELCEWSAATTSGLLLDTFHMNIEEKDVGADDPAGGAKDVSCAEHRRMTVVRRAAPLP